MCKWFYIINIVLICAYSQQNRNQNRRIHSIKLSMSSNYVLFDFRFNMKKKKKKRCISRRNMCIVVRIYYHTDVRLSVGARNDNISE